MHKSFNKEHAAKTPKAQWLKDHAHVEFDGDLGEEWESAQVKKEPKEVEGNRGSKVPPTEK